MMTSHVKSTLQVLGLFLASLLVGSHPASHQLLIGGLADFLLVPIFLGTTVVWAISGQEMAGRFDPIRISRQFSCIMVICYIWCAVMDSCSKTRGGVFVNIVEGLAAALIGSAILGTWFLLVHTAIEVYRWKGRKTR